MFQGCSNLTFEGYIVTIVDLFGWFQGNHMNNPNSKKSNIVRESFFSAHTHTSCNIYICNMYISFVYIHKPGQPSLLTPSHAMPRSVTPSSKYLWECFH